MFKDKFKNLAQNLKLTANIITIIIIILLSLSLLRSITRILSANQKLTDAKNKILASQKEQEDLQRKVAEAKSPEFIESQARDKLGLAKKGEIVVVLPDPETLRLLAPTHEKEETFLPDPNWRKWVKLFF